MTGAFTIKFDFFFGDTLLGLFCKYLLFFIFTQINFIFFLSLKQQEIIRDVIVITINDLILVLYIKWNMICTVCEDTVIFFDTPVHEQKPYKKLCTEKIFSQQHDAVL